mmetsp:Transcript_70175/g.124905  ORF Transcript_70175/g.124905 Transcript_70175/m.124905 type:complete len:344 (+) Transcript_70175:47-1078(+)
MWQARFVDKVAVLIKYLPQSLAFNTCSHCGGKCEGTALDVLNGHRFPQSDKVVIACIGDSITVGIGASNPASTSYPAKLQQMLGEGYDVLNFGACGSSMLKSADDPYTKRPQWHAALQSNANIFIVMLGTNDARPENWARDGRGAAVFQADYMEMIAVLKQLPTNPEVYTVIPPPFYEPHPVPGIIVFSSVVKSIQTVIHNILPNLLTRINKDAGLPSYPISAFNALGGLALSHPEWSADGCHPNDMGYLMIARIIRSRLDSDRFRVGKSHPSACKVSDGFSSPNLYPTPYKSISTYGLLPCPAAVPHPADLRSSMKDFKVVVKKRKLEPFFQHIDNYDHAGA